MRLFRRATTAMQLSHVLPHRIPKGPEGHKTRNALLRAAFPELVTVTTDDELVTGTALIDTFLRHPLFPGVRPVLLARALNNPEPFMGYDQRLTYPFEGEDGDVINPLVPIAPTTDVNVEVLVVASREFKRMSLIAQQLARRFSVTYLSEVKPCACRQLRWARGDGAKWIARSHVVVAAGGSVLYEAIWAGKPFVAAAVLSMEQRVRVDNAIRSGEMVWDGVERMSEAVSGALRADLGPVRPNGIEELRAAVGYA